MTTNDRLLVLVLLPNGFNAEEVLRPIVGTPYPFAVVHISQEAVEDVGAGVIRAAAQDLSIMLERRLTLGPPRLIPPPTEPPEWVRTRAKSGDHLRVDLYGSQARYYLNGKEQFEHER